MVRRTFALQRSCVLEQFATTSHPLAVRFFLSNAQNVSPAHAPPPSITVGRKPFRLSRGEQALASIPQIPTNASDCFWPLLKWLPSLASFPFSSVGRL